jgi:hypothetical protein
MIKALMTEDIPNTHITWRTRLLPLGIDITPVGLPTKALEEAASLNYDIVLMDVLFENYANSGVPHHLRCEGDEAAVQIYSRFNVPILFFTFAPQRVDVHPKAKALASMFGLVDKSAINADAAQVKQKVSDAIAIHGANDQKKGVFALDLNLRFTCINNTAATLLGPLQKRGSAPGPWDPETAKTLRAIIEDAKAGRTVPADHAIVFANTAGAATSLSVTAEPLSFHQGVVGVRCEWPNGKTNVD